MSFTPSQAADIYADWATGCRAEMMRDGVGPDDDHPNHWLARAYDDVAAHLREHCVQPVAVKPLVWQQLGNTILHTRHHAAVQFTINLPEGRDLDYLLLGPGYHTSVSYPTLAAAQAAAQEQWTAFITSALDRSPSP